MRGNLHARFSGGGAAAMRLCYPTGVVRCGVFTDTPPVQTLTLRPGPEPAITKGGTNITAPAPASSSLSNRVSKVAAGAYN